MRTALIHDWLICHAGAERFLQAVQEVFPGDLHTLIHDKKNAPLWKNVRTSFLQKIPFIHSFYRHCIPLFPFAVEQFNLCGYDLILSSSHAVAKNVLTHAGQLHICYCHTPMRYAWDLYHEYTETLSSSKRFLAKRVLHRLRTWDVVSSHRVDHFLANSWYVAKRIQKTYRREAKVIYPPVATDRFSIGPKEEFYLTVSRQVRYKRVDLLVKAFSRLPNRKLVVVGSGPENVHLKALAGSNVEILESVSDVDVAKLMSQARAFLFAAEEDFGLAPIEAQAAGTPVIAYGRGGALETVVENSTGLFFNEQNIESILDAVRRFEGQEGSFSPEKIREHALKFSEERFKREFQQFVNEKIEEFYDSCTRPY